MAKQKTEYVCQQCGNTSPKWMGQCPECGTWNSLVETVLESKSTKNRGTQVSAGVAEQSIVAFKDVQRHTNDQFRLSTGIGEFDRVLGSSMIDGTASNGLVKGSVILLGGEPGIGKSTLLTQLVVNWLIKQQNNKGDESLAIEDNKQQPLNTVMYVSGEESPSQIAVRIERLLKVVSLTHSDSKTTFEPDQTLNTWKDRLLFMTSTNVDEICSIIEGHQPTLVIVDSIQTLSTNDLMGVAGSVGQLRESTYRLTQTVKRLNIPTFLVGHVTKEGEIAGPKILEHVVDSVLELSGERTGEFRTLRAIKNRFGATDEVGIFAMNETGLREVTNPSELFLQYSQNNVPGSAVTCVLEGTRPLLIEVQSLVIKSQLAMPRRVGQGIMLPRIQVLSAVLQKHARVPLGESDIFVNIAGGIQVREPAIDLGVAMAMVSSQKNKPLPKKSIFIGEVGLLGEIRKVQYLERRIKEAKRLGFTQVYSRETHTHISALIKEMM